MPDKVRGDNVNDTSGATSGQVCVCGRLGKRVAVRTLPSGDEVTTFTVVVDRPARSQREGGPTVDSIPCQTFRTSVARKVSGLAEGDEVEVSGSLRRRFWRTPGGSQALWRLRSPP